MQVTAAGWEQIPSLAEAVAKAQAPAEPKQDPRDVDLGYRKA